MIILITYIRFLEYLATRHLIARVDDNSKILLELAILQQGHNEAP